ncbi:MAG: CvpA family protein [Saprospiraceae bacterium]
MAIDIMFALALVSGFMLGFNRGIIKTVFGLIGLLFGCLAAFKFAPGMTRFLEVSFDSTNPLMFLAGAAISFAIAMFSIRLFARGLEGALKTANINVINKLAGGIITAIFMVVVYSVLLNFGVQARVVNDNAQLDSKTYPVLKEIPSKSMVVVNQVRPMFHEFYDQSVDMMDRLQEMSLEKTEDNKVFDIPENEETADSDRR